MGMSGRIFGFSSWSMLVPQALCGVGASYTATTVGDATVYDFTATR